jgi:5-oxoprolinase (ATP-hydrolysing) subunit A
MLSIDLNCDLGEGMNIEEDIMPFISSANIACGYHAGDHHTMKHTVELAIQHEVAVGAHPSFPDRANFGRTELTFEPIEIFQIVFDQLRILSEITRVAGGKIAHVKPHGALYNMAAKDKVLAASIVRAIKEFNPNLMLFGLSGSHLIDEAERAGLKFVGEAFIDRSYQDDGRLTPRSQEGALISDQHKSIQQALGIIQDESVISLSGKIIPIRAETLCIHGDGPMAVQLARQIFEELIAKGIKIQAPGACP